MSALIDESSREIKKDVKEELKQEVHYSVKLSRSKVTPESRSSRRWRRSVGFSVSVLFGCFGIIYCL